MFGWFGSSNGGRVRSRDGHQFRSGTEKRKVLKAANAFGGKKLTGKKLRHLTNQHRRERKGR